MEPNLSVLMVGRIIQEDEVFKQIERAIEIILSLSPTLFYFTDSRTKDKVLANHPKAQAKEFIPAQHHSLVNYIITIGGDGTILYAAKEFKTAMPPIITFQRGSLGFMCRFSLKQMEQILAKLVAYHHKQIEMPFHEIRLIRLEAIRVNTRQEESSKSLKVCINEVYISRRGHERITLQIRVNGEMLTRTAGDGILISTPTGSTAYSLSAGGPILDNGVNGILIVPISPNSLSFRPICLPSTSTIQVKLHASSRSQAYISFDGQSIEQFGFPHQLIMKRSQHDAVFYEPRKNQSQLPSWIQRLKYFLGWNEKYKAPMENYSVEKIEISPCKHQQGPNNDIQIV